MIKMKTKYERSRNPLKNCIARLIAFCLMTVIAAGCATSRQGQRLTQGSLDVIRQDVVRDLERYNEGRYAMKGMAQFYFAAHGSGRRSDMAFLLEKPDSLKLEALSDFGPLTFEFSMYEGMINIHWPHDDRRFEGIASRATLEEYLSVSLNPNELLDAFLGIVPLEEENAYQIKPSKKAEEFSLKGLISRLTVRKEGEHYLPVKVTYLDIDGAKKTEILYDRFEEKSGRRVPMSIEAKFWEPTLKVRVQLQDVELNPKVDRKRFKLLHE